MMRVSILRIMAKQPQIHRWQGVFGTPPRQWTNRSMQEKCKIPSFYPSACIHTQVSKSLRGQLTKDTKEGSISSDVMPITPDKLLSYYEGNLVPPDFWETKEEPVSIIEQIKNMDPEDIVEFVEHNYMDMNKIDYASCMKRLQRFCSKLEHEDALIFKEELQKQKGFKMLCALLGLKARHLNSTMAYDMTQFLAYFDIDSHNPVMQVYLQLAKFHINNLALDQLINLSVTVGSMVQTKQTQVLLQGLQVLIGARDDGINTLSHQQLAHALELSGNHMKDERKQYILDQFHESVNNIGAHSSVALLKALAAIKHEDGVLISTCIQRLKNADNLNDKEIIDVLQAVHQLDVDDFKLTEKLGEIATKFPLDSPEYLTDALHILSAMLDNEHIHGGFARQFTSALEDFIHRWAFSDCDIKSLVPVLANLRPVCHLNAESLRKLNESIESVVPRISPSEVLDVLFNVSVLHQPPTALLQHVLDDNVLKEMTSYCGCVSDSSGWARAEKLVMALWLARESQTPCTFTFKQIDIAYKESCDVVYHLFNERCIPFKSVLEAIAGTDSVIHGAVSRSGICIDHLLWVKDGSFVSILDQEINEAEMTSKFVEDYLISSCQSVAVVAMPTHCFHANTGRLNGIGSLYIEQLEKQGHIVVMIHEAGWRNLYEPEREAYLEQKILSAAEDGTSILIGTTLPPSGNHKLGNHEHI